MSNGASDARPTPPPTSQTPSFMSRLEHVPGFQPFRRVALFAERVIHHAYFDVFVMVAILFNTVCLAIDHHNMSEDLRIFLESSNKGFLAVRIPTDESCWNQCNVCVRRRSGGKSVPPASGYEVQPGDPARDSALCSVAVGTLAFAYIA